MIFIGTSMSKAEEANITRADNFITMVEGLLGFKKFLLAKKALTRKQYHQDPHTWKLLAVSNGSLG